MTADLPGEPASAPSTMRRDVASAYFAAASKIGSWVVVSALVYRTIGPIAFSMLTLVRATIGLLNYITLGLAPALIHHAAQTPEAPGPSQEQEQQGGEVLEYYAPAPLRVTLPLIYSNAVFITYAAGVVGAILIVLYADNFNYLYRVPRALFDHMPLVVGCMGVGALLRLMGDAPGAVLQVRSRISLDNLLMASGEFGWAVLSAAACLLMTPSNNRLDAIAVWYAISGAITFLVRKVIADRETGIWTPKPSDLHGGILGALLIYGTMVVLAQLADYLYAPTDYILIDRLLDPVDVANYAPAVQLDSGLLLLVTGLSAVLLPKAAIAHGSGDAKTVRQYYLVGTVASFVLLAVASTSVWLLSPWIFRLWLGNPMPVTQSILPIVLLNTVIGGSSAVGRSILLAVGRVRPFTISVLIAGVTNVICSYAFVRWFHWGLRGIVLGTVVAVIGRCLIWMPWYVLKTLRENREGGNREGDAPAEPRLANAENPARQEPRPPG
jgi:O-antigen/teichoic acid export membrane protein